MVISEMLYPMYLFLYRTMPGNDRIESSPKVCGLCQRGQFPTGRSLHTEIRM